MPKITRIISREILDSRANPTIETSVLLSSGAYGTASVPSGTTSSETEDVEIRDADPARYGGLGVLKAVANVNEKIAPKLIGVDARDQEQVDQIMLDLDGTKNKSNLGANAILSVSMAALKAAANYTKLPLFLYVSKKYGNTAPLIIPHPMFNIINGGKHGAGNLDFQEFQVVPSTRFSYSDSLRLGVEIYQLLKLELIHRNAIHSVGDEGGFAPNLFTNSDALEIITMAIKNSLHKLNQDIYLALDTASDTFYKDSKYSIKDLPRSVDRASMIEYYQNLLKDYPLFSLEDPLEKDDFDGWAKLRQVLPPNTLIVGDDLLTTNSDRFKKAIDAGSCNTILVKPNQAGTVTATVAIIKQARDNNIYSIVSHRSGETNDTFIADFAVGIGANFTKFGAPIRGERVAKYNRLLEIESYLNAASK